MIIRFLKKYFLSILVTIAIFYLSTATSSSFTEMPKVEGMDKVIHVLMYFGLALVLTLEVSGDKKIKYYFFVIIYPLLYGGLIEILQENFFPPRTADIFDFFADAIGVFAGFFIAKELLKIKEIRKLVGR